MAKTIKNPIITGFNPDPSILRVGDTYYIANSTFEWFPGVQIHKSKDLQNWQLCAKPLDTAEKLDLKGVPDSCGVWAPCLTYSDGLYYLVYSNVKSFDGIWKDTPNYLVTTDDIEYGQWSDPIFLDSSGFDASLYHDDDGRKWYLTLIVDHRKGKFFGGIGIQEYSVSEQALIGEMKLLWEGSSLGVTEGPHIYKRNGYYYLMTAEGGTEYGHAVSLARSKELMGPYETHPSNPLISSRKNPNNYLQKTGHGSLVETADGTPYVAFLTSRPLTELGRCTLGRETAIQKMVWKSDDWLYLAHGGQEAKMITEGLDTPAFSWQPLPDHDDFDEDQLNINFNSLRIPVTEDWCTLKERKGFLRLYGRDSLASLHQQSFIARRIQHFNVEVETMLEFNPSDFQQSAGLVFYYNTMHMHYLHLTRFADRDMTCLQIITGDNGKFTEALSIPVDVDNAPQVYLRARMTSSDLQFYYSVDGNDWRGIGPVLDASILSDDYVRDNGLHYRAAFTGAFVGLCCQDLSGHNNYADFDYFKYQVLE